MSEVYTIGVDFALDDEDERILNTMVYVKPIIPLEYFSIEIINSKELGRVWEIGGPRKSIKNLKDGKITCLIRD